MRREQPRIGTRKYSTWSHPPFRIRWLHPPPSNRHTKMAWGRVCKSHIWDYILWRIGEYTPLPMCWWRWSDVISSRFSFQTGLESTWKQLGATSATIMRIDTSLCHTQRHWKIPARCMTVHSPRRPTIPSRTGSSKCPRTSRKMRTGYRKYCNRS